MGKLDELFKATPIKKVDQGHEVNHSWSSAYANDKSRSGVLESELQLVEELMENSSVPQRILNTVSINLSTSDISRQRPVPTRADKVRALWDYWKFLDIINFHGGSIAFAQCHRELIGWKLRPDANFRQLVLEARGMLKSTLLSVGYTLWRIYQNPNIRMFVGCESLKLSKAFMREIESYLTDEWNQEHVWNSRPHIDGPLIPIMDSLGKSRRELVRDISSEFGDEFSTDPKKVSTAKKVWRAEAIQVVRTRNLKEPTVTAGSVGQTSTGFHYDEVIFDDVHTFDNCSSESKIDKVYSWIYDIESVLDDPYVDIELLKCFRSIAGSTFNQLKRWAISGGRVTTIGTRYDDLDYYGHIIENKDALNYETHIRNIYVNGQDPSDGYRWPEKWNEDVENEKRAQFERKHGSTGLARFYSQYHNKIVNLEDAVLDWEQIQWLNPASFKLEEDNFVSIFNLDGTLKARFKPRLVVDPTSTSSSTSDFCAIVVGGVYENALYVLDFWMKRERVEIWLDKMYDFVNKWNLHEAVIEMVGGFKIVEFAIRKLWQGQPDKYRPIAIKDYSPPTNTGDGKNARIETILSPLVSNSLLYLPLYCSRDRDLKKQFIFFGKATTKDDGVDVLAILKETAFTFYHPAKGKGKAKQGPRVHPVHGGVVYGDFQQNSPSYAAIEARLNA